MTSFPGAVGLTCLVQLLSLFPWLNVGLFLTSKGRRGPAGHCVSSADQSLDCGCEEGSSVCGSPALTALHKDRRSQRSVLTLCGSGRTLLLERSCGLLYITGVSRRSRSQELMLGGSHGAAEAPGRGRVQGACPGSLHPRGHQCADGPTPERQHQLTVPRTSYRLAAPVHLLPGESPPTCCGWTSLQFLPRAPPSGICAPSGKPCGCSCSFSAHSLLLSFFFFLVN